MALIFTICLAVLAQHAAGTCIREFFAQPVIYDKAMDIDFYYTGINLKSVKACAEFCADRHFCRTAVYNSYSKTCAISYEYTLNCRYNQARVSDFDLSKATSHLIQIACVTKCNEEATKENVHKPVKLLTGEPTEPVSRVPATLKKVEIITGEPNDGLRENSQQRNSPQIFQDQAPPAPQSEGKEFVNKLIIDNITQVLHSPSHDMFVSRMMKSGSQTCYRQIKHRFLLRSSFERHDGTTLNECRCLCADTYKRTGKHHLCQSFHWYRKTGSCMLNKGSHRGKYDLIKDWKATYEYVDCDVQVLLDVASKACGTKNTGNRKNIKNAGKHKHKKVTKPPKRTTVAEHTTSASTEAPAFVTEVPDKKEEKENRSIENGSGQAPETNQEENEENVKASSKTEEKSEADSEKSTPSETESEKQDDKKNNDSTETERNQAEPNSVESTYPEPTIKKEEEVTTSSTTEVEATTSTTTESPSAFVTDSGKPESQKNLPIQDWGCFEHVPGYMMVSVAGGLEHSVSLDECQCICANSKGSGKYKFDCASATYYHRERDCVLNLADRKKKPEYFEKQPADFKVTYIGVTCDRPRAIASVTDKDLILGCKTAQKPHTTKAPKKHSRSRSRGAHSDKCFLELPSFVLEGVAQQVETSVTPEECKCMCAQAETKYGERCQSFQYYYDSRTCLLNKQNRFSNPEKFNYVPSSQPRSYFEFKCGVQGDKLAQYVNNECIDESVSRNELNTEPNPIQLDTHKKDVSIESSSKEESAEVEVSTKPYQPTTEAVEIVETRPIDNDSKVEERNHNVVEDVSSTTNAPTTQSVTMVSVSGEVTTPEYETSTESKEIEKTVEERGTKKQKEDKEEDRAKEKEIEKDEESEEKDNEPNDDNKLNSSIEEQTPQSIEAQKLKKSEKFVKINRAIPETEGLSDKDFEDKPLTKLSSELDAPTVQTTKTIPQTPQFDPIQPLTTIIPHVAKHQKHIAHGIKTKEFSNKVEKTKKLPEPEEVTTTEEPTTTEETTVSTTTEEATTTLGYPPAGTCTYSALYQTAFSGRKMLKTVFVKTPADCFAACFALRCRSANLVSQGEFNQCELYRDSLIDYRRPDMIGYDGSSVYFDGIRCDGKPQF